MDISIIICTYNRAGLLDRVIDSLAKIEKPDVDYEILIVDNNSADKTKEVVQKKIYEYKYNMIIRYLLEVKTGLHNARHLGAEKANGDILCYLDDDVTVDKYWLKGVIETFRNTDAVLVGGKILPKYEVQTPKWIDEFWMKWEAGKCLGILSLIDLGNGVKEIEASYIWGCNFSVKKHVIFECGGFHPDAMPDNLVIYRGDGETGLSRKISEKGYKVYYTPKACVYHYVSKERLTAEYFCKRMFQQGISDSFSEIRKNGEPLDASMTQFRVSGKLSSAGVKNDIQLAYIEGYNYHQRKVHDDPKLREWVLRKNFFGENGRLPER